MSKRGHVRSFIIIMLVSTCSASLFDSKNDKYESINWLKRIADKNQDANLRAKTQRYDFKNIFTSDVFDLDQLKKSSFELLDSGIPSKVGYGFLMGYTSGICLKKVIKTWPVYMFTFSLIVNEFLIAGFETASSGGGWHLHFAPGAFLQGVRTLKRGTFHISNFFLAFMTFLPQVCVP